MLAFIMGTITSTQEVHFSKVFSAWTWERSQSHQSPSIIPDPFNRIIFFQKRRYPYLAVASTFLAATPLRRSLILHLLFVFGVLLHLSSKLAPLLFFFLLTDVSFNFLCFLFLSNNRLYLLLSVEGCPDTTHVNLDNLNFK